MFRDPDPAKKTLEDMASNVKEMISFLGFVLFNNPTIIDEWRKNHKTFTEEERLEFEKKEQEKFNVK